MTGRHEELARMLLEAERSGQPIDPLSDSWPELTVHDAYRIQTLGRELRHELGARVVGRKIGLTSHAMQELLGVDEPDFGYLTDTMVYASGGDVPIGKAIAPRVEAEILFRLRGGLRPSPTADDVLAATAEVAPALEIVDSRIRDWRIRLTDTIADNASSHSVVVGAFRPLGELDLQRVSMTMTVQADGRSEVVDGTGEAVLGHPARAVAWLAGSLRRYGAEGLADGDLVLPGAMARAVPVDMGARATASFAGLGEVSVRFVA